MFKDKTDQLGAQTVLAEMVATGDLSRLDGNTVKVYLMVKSVAVGKPFPTTALIAKKTGLSEGQVIECLKSLEAFGYVGRMQPNQPGSTKR